MLLKYLFYILLLSSAVLTFSIFLFPEALEDLFEYFFAFMIPISMGLIGLLMSGGGGSEDYNPNDHVYRNGKPIDMDRAQNKWK